MRGIDWLLGIKDKIKPHRTLATLCFYLTDLAYLNLAERRRFVRSFPSGARCLNLAAGFRRSPEGFWGIDLMPYRDISIRASIAQLPLRDESVDGILCEMALEHVPDANQVLAEFRRVLRPGGRIYLAVPFLWPFHASPHDYRRWTLRGIEQDMVGFRSIAVGISGGPTTALCNVLLEWLALALSFNIEWLYRGLFLVLIPILTPLKLADLLLSRYRHAERIGSLLFFHGEKSNDARSD